MSELEQYLKTQSKTVDALSSLIAALTAQTKQMEKLAASNAQLSAAVAGLLEDDVAEGGDDLSVYPYLGRARDSGD